jgi:hypothetical protein
VDFLKWARYHWDRVAAGFLVGLGLLTLLLGYLGVSGTVYPAEQLPYMISGGILGIFFLGTAAVLYLSADMRDEWRKLDSIDTSLKELVGQSTRDADTETTDVGTPPVAETATPENSNGSKPRATTRQGTKRTSTRQRAGTRS